MPGSSSQVGAYIVRGARAEDLPGITSIYNEVIEHTTAVYLLEPTSVAERRAWFEARAAAGCPVLVAVGADGVLGFASFGAFRAMPGYDATVEHSVHVRADCRGRGVGTRLLRELLPLARAAGKHVMVAAIDADNDGSLRLHDRLGFERVGQLHEVGRKFGRWLDVVLVQRVVDV